MKFIAKCEWHSETTREIKASSLEEAEEIALNDAFWEDVTNNEIGRAAKYEEITVEET